jgi:2-dehydropantoate 2-reductase
MRIVVFGAGAVGGVIGGRLFQFADRHGHDVTLVVRGAHFEAVRDRGLVINDPGGSVTLPVPAVDRIDAVPLEPGDVVVLAMKTQDTTGALEALRAHAPDGVVIACAQNGVENERLALRMFGDVYGICVMLPATLMEPGIVDASGLPHNAILDVGRYPTGVDATAEALARALEASGLSSKPSEDVMRFKYRKLMMNLANALDALVVAGDDSSPLYAQARAEAEACFAAAGIDAATDEEDRARRHGVMKIAPIDGRPRGGGSTWQSLARGATSTEVDWLNGEIVLLGRLHGVPTPVNAMLQAVSRKAAAAGTEPRSIPAADLLARLD